MKSIVSILLIFLILTGCTKKELTNIIHKDTLTINVLLSNGAGVQPAILANVYIYKGIDFNKPVNDNYEYLGAGKIKNKVTGVTSDYTDKRSSDINGKSIFESIDDDTYQVIVDVSGITIEGKTLVNKWDTRVITLPQNIPGIVNALNFMINF